MIKKHLKIEKTKIIEGIKRIHRNKKLKKLKPTPFKYQPGQTGRKHNFLNIIKGLERNLKIFNSFPKSLSVLLVAFSRPDIRIFDVRRFPFLTAKHDAGSQMLLPTSPQNMKKGTYHCGVLSCMLC